MPTPKKETAPTVTTVQSTTRYGKFKFLDANREVNESHVNAIKRSLNNNGNFTEAQPIIVNERFQIIDGQHRFTALKELDLPVFYTVLAGAGAEQAQHMNLLQRPWNTTDYLKVYTAQGRQPYIIFNELVEEYPDVSATLINVYVAGGERNGMHSAFRRGELEMSEELQAVVRERLDKLMEMRAICTAFQKRAVATALVKAILSEGYSHKKMLEKVQQQAADIKAYQSVPDNLRQLENVYNWHVTPANHVRFF